MIIEIVVCTLTVSLRLHSCWSEYDCRVLHLSFLTDAEMKWNVITRYSSDQKAIHLLLGLFHGAIAVPSVTRCRCRRCGHRTPPAL